MMSRPDPVAPQALRDQLQDIVNKHGRARAAQFLGVSSPTLKNVLLGGAVMSGTLAILREKLAERAGRVP